MASQRMSLTTIVPILICAMCCAASGLPLVDVPTWSYLQEAQVYLLLLLPWHCLTDLAVLALIAALPCD